MPEHEIQNIIADSPAPQLDNPHEVTAELLVYLIHRGVDWSVWGGERRYRYWDALSDRVRAATYAGSTIQDWWEAMEKQIKSQPRNPEDRAFAAILLGKTPQEQRLILGALRKHASTLVMRIRVHIEHSKKNGKETS